MKQFFLDLRDFVIKTFKFLAGFIQGKTNESLKRLIALIFSLTFVRVYFLENNIEIKTLLTYIIGSLIALLLGLATAENIINIFQKKNNSEKTE